METQRSKPIIVQKYGGSSLATPEHFKRVAENILRRRDQGVDLVIVVSAMGKTTDEYIKLAYQVNPNPDRREMDMLLSVGERISIALLALAINAFGKYKAVSFTGSQVGIITDDNHTQARILEVKGLRLREALDEGKIVIVAGFQGVSIHKEITTLGRGGSDTTAVALAAALNAEACEIMSDVDGIYTADPNIIPTARRIERIHFDEALQMAAAGASMLQKRSVEFAKRHHVKLSLGSSFTGKIGTIVTDESMAKGCVRGIVSDDDLIVFKGLCPQGDRLNVPLLLAEAAIEPKVYQHIHEGLLVGVSKSDGERVEALLKDVMSDVEQDSSWSLLSIIGSGVGIGSPSCEQFLGTLKSLGMACETVVSDELYTKVLVPSHDVRRALEATHRQFFDTKS